MWCALRNDQSSSHGSLGRQSLSMRKTPASCVCRFWVQMGLPAVHLPLPRILQPPPAQQCQPLLQSRLPQYVMSVVNYLKDVHAKQPHAPLIASRSGCLLPEHMCALRFTL